MRKRLAVFDLDFTLWDAGGVWCDCTDPPYSRDGSGRVFDSRGREIRLYEEVPEVLEYLAREGIGIGLASRTDAPLWADELTRLLGIDPHVGYREIYPGCKIRHLTRISEASGVGFSEMVFFDDERRNVRDAESIGVESVWVRRGVDLGMVRDAVGGS